MCFFYSKPSFKENSSGNIKVRTESEQNSWRKYRCCFPNLDTSFMLPWAQDNFKGKNMKDTTQQVSFVQSFKL